MKCLVKAGHLSNRCSAWLVECTAIRLKLKANAPEGSVSKEAVVLRRWESGTRTFSINNKG